MRKILIVDLEKDFAKHIRGSICHITPIMEGDIIVCTPDEAMNYLAGGDVVCISTELLLSIPRYTMSMGEVLRDVFGIEKFSAPDWIKNSATYGDSDFGGINFIRNIRMKYPMVPICVFSLIGPYESPSVYKLVTGMIGDNFIGKTSENGLERLSEFFVSYYK